MSELKPCPFCGSTKIDLGQFEVYCQTCGMGKFYHMAVTTETLIAEWNERTTPPREDVSDSQMRAMIDQACEDLGRHGLEPTDEAAQVVLNLIASASELGRLVRLRNGPSAVEALLYDAFEAGWFDNHGSIADAWAERGPEIRARLTHSTEDG